MRQEIRERYGELLEPLSKDNMVGEMTEKELLLGRTLKRIREHRQISLEDLAEGICPVSELSAMEKGTKVNLLLTSAYLLRMGKSVNKFEFYSTNTEYEKKKKRDQIVQTWKSGELDKAETLLEEYRRDYRTRLGGVWDNWQKLCIQLCRDILPEKQEKLWKALMARKLYFIQEEWDYLWELVKYYERSGNVERAREVYALMYQNCMVVGVFLPQDGKGMDEERKLEILPMLCLQYGRFEHRQGRTMEAIQVVNDAISLLLRNMRMDYLYELLEERLSIHTYMWEQTKQENFYQGLVEDAQYLAALDFLNERDAAARRRFRWLKEEMKWESTILDNLFTDQEKPWV